MLDGKYVHVCSVCGESRFLKCSPRKPECPKCTIRKPRVTTVRVKVSRRVSPDLRQRDYTVIKKGSLPRLDYFWERVKPLPSGCWVYAGNRGNRIGHGMVPMGWRNGRSQMEYAHRIVWMLANALPIPDGLYVCHKCDNPPCVNPAHLFLGTAADNTHDMIDKGRQRYRPKKEMCDKGHPVRRDEAGSLLNCPICGLREGKKRSGIALTAEHLTVVPEREAVVLSRYYGVGRESPQTFDQIASLLGLSRGRIQQIRDRALERLEDVAA